MAKRITEEQLLQEYKNIVLYTVKKGTHTYLTCNMMDSVRTFNEDGLYIFVDTIDIGGRKYRLKFEMENGTNYTLVCDKSNLDIGENYFAPTLGKRSLHALSDFIIKSIEAHSL